MTWCWNRIGSVLMGRKKMDKQKVEFIESYIKIGNGDYEWHDNHGELIRCKDCKWNSGTARKPYCQLFPFMRTRKADWFCADGERGK